jgi:acetyl-CoA carboxylase biotin carboxyl carrier protein
MWKLRNAGCLWPSKVPEKAAAKDNMAKAKKTQARKKENLPEYARAADKADLELLLRIRSLASILDEYQLSEINVHDGSRGITVRRGGVSAPVQYAAVPGAVVAPASTGSATPPPQEEKGHLVTSPFVGTFYKRPNPDAATYVNVGDRVEKGKVLCIVEAMKLMNEIEADLSGTLTAVLVEDGASVEYGQPLFRIVP